ncbi:MAG: glycosyltransferase family 9 protein [Deltaproteobacteria bacterium]|nr:glycosyltransferase family 9 protein [Deltaproteobacteria bacterium]
MTKETIKRIDALLGSVICWLLTLHRRVYDLFALQPPPGDRPKKILFLKLIEQGATVLAAPAIKAAVDRCGRENVYFAVFPENRPILDILELIPKENVLELRHGDLLSFARDALGLFWRCRQLGIDTVVDMEFMARASAILAYLSGARFRVGLFRFTSEGPYRGDLMTHRVQYNPYLHTSIAYRLLFEALDQDPAEVPLLKIPTRRPPDRPRFVPTATETARVKEILRSRLGRPVPGPLVLLNPNTGDLLPTRMWPTERFIELGRRLLAEHPDLTLGITGAPSERAGAEAVAQQIGTDRVVCLAGATTLREVLVLYTLADVLVTNDSGPGHFASMTDIHNVVLFGPETPQLFGPLGENRHVLWAQLACSPCVSPYNHRFSPCTNNRCMQVINVDEVHQVVTRALHAVRAQPKRPHEPRSVEAQALPAR